MLLGAFVRDVRAADLVATGHHELAVGVDLPVSRPVLRFSMPVVPALSASPAVAPVPEPVQGVEVPLAVSLPVEVEAPPPPVAPPEPIVQQVAEDPPPAGPEGTGEYLGSFKVTCYALQGITFSGAPVALDGVAVDPAVIDIGASVYIDGLGWKVARDTGRLIIDKTIDIWNPSRDWCIQWGVQYHDVWSAAR